MTDPDDDRPPMPPQLPVAAVLGLTEALHQFKQAAVAAGFSEDQAMHLTTAWFIHVLGGS